MVLAIITYPLAYARSTRQAVEGSIAPNTRSLLFSLPSASCMRRWYGLHRGAPSITS